MIDSKHIVIRANPRYTKAEIDDVLHQKQAWINKQVQRFVQMESAMDHEDRDAFYLLGKKYHLLYQMGLLDNVELTKDTILVTYQVETKKVVVLERHLNQMLANVVQEQVTHCLTYFTKLQRPVVELKRMKSRWGTCYVQRRKIVLNVALLHVPYHCLDYVIIHELMHFYYPDHQAGFHQAMAKVMPKYKEYQKELRQYEYLLRK